MSTTFHLPIRRIYLKNDFLQETEQKFLPGWWLERVMQHPNKRIRKRLITIGTTRKPLSGVEFLQQCCQKLSLLLFERIPYYSFLSYCLERFTLLRSPSTKRITYSSQLLYTRSCPPGCLQCRKVSLISLIPRTVRKYFPSLPYVLVHLCCLLNLPS